MRGGSQCSQPIWIGGAVAKRSCNARGTRFLENNPVAAVLDYAATTFGRNDGQAVRLRFELRNRKSIRKCRKNEYVGSSVFFSRLLSRHRTKPFHARIVCCCLSVCDLNGSNDPKFDWLIAQSLSRLQ